MAPNMVSKIQNPKFVIQNFRNVKNVTNKIRHELTKLTGNGIFYMVSKQVRGHTYIMSSLRGRGGGVSQMLMMS